jgi:N-acetylglucosamine-6-phosphate deacetylase
MHRVHRGSRHRLLCGSCSNTRTVLKRVTIAPELPKALAAIEAFRGRGISVSGGHSDAWDEDARAAFERGMRSVTHTFNCMSTARRRGIYRVAGLLEFALSELRHQL